MNKTTEYLSSIVLKDNTCVSVHDGKRSLSYFCQKAPLRVDRKLLDELKRVYSSLDGRNLRVCLHESPEASLHQMLILEGQDSYYRPHKHKDKSETIHIIEGKMGVFSFDDDGSIVDACLLEHGKTIIYQVPKQMYHVVLPISKLIVYQETKLGPFLGVNDSIYPDWAPEENDTQAFDNFEQKLKTTLGV